MQSREVFVDGACCLLQMLADLTLQDLGILALFVGLQCGDAWTTRAILKRGGYELNPVLRWLALVVRPFSGARWAWLFIGKMVAIAAFFLLVVIDAVHAQALCVLLYLFVVIHNWKTLRGMNGKD